ncbi:transposase [Mesorhizobium neociceri]|uniref:Mutator family transposase n=1 Tax=Mesorhizobium neociceri TaxID=1307853 RepID=A0A838BH76_9HYPH|nr:transposase [Mesorhizobium neociceri]MBA1145407.1 transposase [Mesorhizobium neociceri]
MNKLKSRGVSHILIAVVDGLKGFPEAINAVFLQTVVKTFTGSVIPWSSCLGRTASPSPALRAIYRAKDAEAGMKALEDFETSYWGSDIRRSRKAHHG